MSTKELAAEIINNLSAPALKKEKKAWKYDFTAVNFAAPDMIGHTGNLKAGIECCHLVDKYLGKIVKAYSRSGGTVLITADHGNIEQMINLKTQEIDTEHSTNLVPLILINKKLEKINLRSGGVLCDIAPTMLFLMNLPQPPEMTGQPLLQLADVPAQAVAGD